MTLKINHISKALGTLSLYRDFTIAFDHGRITCILGPSGCGKTTLLHIIGGIVLPDSGTLDGFAGKRISYIFQDPRLLPWKTARENIEFVLPHDLPPTERKQLADHFIDLVELRDFEGYYPARLSGGMRQRVAIARAFAFPSDIILMDEPLKGLDVKLKLNLIRTFSRIWESDRRTVIFVTHDVEESLLLSNEIIVMSRPPVQIADRRKVEIPVLDRSLESPTLMVMKSELIRVLGV
jgi:NitT/TauT family transport system ATP-binding protein